MPAAVGIFADALIILESEVCAAFGAVGGTFYFLLHIRSLLFFLISILYDFFAHFSIQKFVSLIHNCGFCLKNYIYSFMEVFFLAKAKDHSA